MPIKNPDGTDKYPNSAYYEIGLNDYTQKLYFDLPPTLLRGYKDLNPAADGNNHYLGPLIVALRDRVRGLSRRLKTSPFHAGSCSITCHIWKNR